MDGAEAMWHLGLADIRWKVLGFWTYLEGNTDSPKRSLSHWKWGPLSLLVTFPGAGPGRTFV